MNPRPCFVGGEERTGPNTYEVRNPYDGSLVAAVTRPGETDLEDSLSAAVEGFRAVRSLPVWKRADALLEVSRRLETENERFARTIALEAGKPIAQARVEAARAVQTFRIAAEEARRLGGELIPLDLAPGNEGRFGITRRFPVGPVACISPFNFPLNLVAHKVAPALAAGCSFVLKPASQTPLSALDLAGLLLEAGFPPEAISVLPLASSAAESLAEDPRLRALSFTGSAEVGWELRRKAFRKRVVLELGGNAGVIVDRSADLDFAVPRIAAGAFGYAGQVCISVQRIYVHEEVFEPFLESFLARVDRLVVGDPLDERTAIGPVIADADADRIESWIEEAIGGGARALRRGHREGRILGPTVLTGTAPEMKVCASEVFAPVVVVEQVRDAQEAIDAVDRSEFGLQAGVFTRDLAIATAAHERIEVGAVVVNDVPTYRVDHMPYGGVKESGIGREGPAYAIEDYTEIRLLVVNPR
jgi:glyceraldehyde-3-phosphate dehydrogenase (NADP+)